MIQPVFKVSVYREQNLTVQEKIRHTLKSSLCIGKIQRRRHLIPTINMEDICQPDS